MQFAYFEIKAALEITGPDGAAHVESFYGRPVMCEERGAAISTPQGAATEAKERAAALTGGETCGPVFWTLYGRDGEGMAHAIGDFESFPAALAILNAILAPMAAARDKLETMPHAGNVRPLIPAACDLDDVINQSSTEERL